MLSTTGIKNSPTSIAAAMTMILAIVPNPGLCLSGIQSRSTSTETKNVDSPIFKTELIDIPSERTTQGELPRPDTTKNASPIPNIVNPKKRIANL